MRIVVRLRHKARARRAASVLLALLVAIAGPALAKGPVNYTLDPVHTRVAFAVSHAGFSKPIGTVSGSTGTLLFDPDDWTSARLEASVPMTRLDLGDDKWNRAALATNLLNADKYPAATFVSTRIEPIAPDRASVYGLLTLRGVAKEVKLDVTLNAVKRHPMPPFRPTAGFSATTTISRKAFGMDAWPTVIGDSVELRIEAEATRARAAGDDAGADTSESSDADAPTEATPEDTEQGSEPEPDSDQTPEPATEPSP